MKRSCFRRVTAFLTVFTFIFIQITAPVPGFAQLVQAPFQNLTNSEVHSPLQVAPIIPDDLGTVQTFAQGSGPVIFHIQTAHGNYEAQKKIESILHYLKDRYGVKLLLLEGSAFKLKPEVLKFFPERMDVTKKIADELTKRALVKGAELFLLDDSESEGRGIERVELYRQNREAFKAVLLEKEKTGQFVGDMDRQIENLTAPDLNKNLRSFLAETERHEKGGISVPDWLTYLKSQSQVHLNIDLTDPVNQLNWPMLVRIYKLKTLESKLDLSTYPNEKKEFLKAIHRIPKDVFTQIEGLLKSPLSDQKLPDPDTEILFEKMVTALPADFNYGAYPNVTCAIGHLLLRSEIKGELFAGELNRLQEEITSRLAESKEEKEIVALLGDYRLLARLFSLELTPDDYETILSRKNALMPSVIVKRFLEINRSKRVRDVKFDHVDDIQSLFEKALEFYRFVKERDTVMLENAAAKIEELKAEKAVVITGGFHSGPFQDFFAGKNYNYALISPKITSLDETGHQSYIRAILQSPEQVKSSTMESAFISVSPEELAQEGNDISWIRREVDSAVRDVLAKEGIDPEQLKRRKIIEQAKTPVNEGPVETVIGGMKVKMGAIPAASPVRSEARAGGFIKYLIDHVPDFPELATLLTEERAEGIFAYVNPKPEVVIHFLSTSDETLSRKVEQRAAEIANAARQFHFEQSQGSMEAGTYYEPVPKRAASSPRQRAGSIDLFEFERLLDLEQWDTLIHSNARVRGEMTHEFLLQIQRIVGKIAKILAEKSNLPSNAAEYLKGFGTTFVATLAVTSYLLPEATRQYLGAPSNKHRALLWLSFGSQLSLAYQDRATHQRTWKMHPLGQYLENGILAPFLIAMHSPQHDAITGTAFYEKVLSLGSPFRLKPSRDVYDAMSRLKSKLSHPPLLFETDLLLGKPVAVANLQAVSAAFWFEMGNILEVNRTLQGAEMLKRFQISVQEDLNVSRSHDGSYPLWVPELTLLQNGTKREMGQEEKTTLQNPMSKQYSPDLAGMKEAIADTIGWILRQDIEDRAGIENLLRSYQASFDQRSLAMTPAETAGGDFKFTQEFGPSGEIIHRVNVEYFSQMFQDMRTLPSDDFFIENFASLVLDQAWTFHFLLQKMDEARRIARKAGLLYGNEREKAGLPERPVINQQFLLFARTHKDKIENMMAFRIASQLFSILQARKFLDEMHNLGLYDAFKVRADVEASGSAHLKRVSQGRQSQLFMEDKRSSVDILQDLIEVQLFSTLVPILASYQASKNISLGNMNLVYFLFLEVNEGHIPAGVALQGKTFARAALIILPEVKQYLQNWGALRSEARKTKKTDDVTPYRKAALNVLSAAKKRANKVAAAGKQASVMAEAAVSVMHELQKRIWNGYVAEDFLSYIVSQRGFEGIGEFFIRGIQVYSFREADKRNSNSLLPETIEMATRRFLRVTLNEMVENGSLDLEHLSVPRTPLPELIMQLAPELSLAVRLVIFVEDLDQLDLDDFRSGQNPNDSDTMLGHDGLRSEARKKYGVYDFQQVIRDRTYAIWREFLDIAVKTGGYPEVNNFRYTIDSGIKIIEAALEYQVKRQRAKLVYLRDAAIEAVQYAVLNKEQWPGERDRISTEADAIIGRAVDVVEKQVAAKKKELDKESFPTLTNLELDASKKMIARLRQMVLELVQSTDQETDLAAIEIAKLVGVSFDDGSGARSELRTLIDKAQTVEEIIDIFQTFSVRSGRNSIVSTLRAKQDVSRSEARGKTSAAVEGQENQPAVALVNGDRLALKIERGLDRKDSYSLHLMVYAPDGKQKSSESIPLRISERQRAILFLKTAANELNRRSANGARQGTFDYDHFLSSFKDWIATRQMVDGNQWISHARSESRGALQDVELTPHFRSASFDSKSKIPQEIFFDLRPSRSSHEKDNDYLFRLQYESIRLSLFLKKQELDVAYPILTYELRQGDTPLTSFLLKFASQEALKEMKEDSFVIEPASDIDFVGTAAVWFREYWGTLRHEQLAGHRSEAREAQEVALDYRFARAIWKLDETPSLENYEILLLIQKALRDTEIPHDELDRIPPVAGRPVFSKGGPRILSSNENGNLIGVSGPNQFGEGLVLGLKNIDESRATNYILLRVIGDHDLVTKPGDIYENLELIVGISPDSGELQNPQFVNLLRRMLTTDGSAPLRLVGGEDSRLVSRSEARGDSVIGRVIVNDEEVSLPTNFRGIVHIDEILRALNFKEGQVNQVRIIGGPQSIPVYSSNGTGGFGRTTVDLNQRGIEIVASVPETAQNIQTIELKLAQAVPLELRFEGSRIIITDKVINKEFSRTLRDGEVIKIGRHTDNDVVLTHDLVSRSHLEIMYKNKIWSMRDVGSTRGTFYRDEKLENNTWISAPSLSARSETRSVTNEEAQGLIQLLLTNAALTERKAGHTHNFVQITRFSEQLARVENWDPDRIGKISERIDQFLKGPVSGGLPGEARTVLTVVMNYLKAPEDQKNEGSLLILADEFLRAQRSEARKIEELVGQFQGRLFSVSAGTMSRRAFGASLAAAAAWVGFAKFLAADETVRQTPSQELMDVDALFGVFKDEKASAQQRKAAIEAAVKIAGGKDRDAHARLIEKIKEELADISGMTFHRPPSALTEQEIRIMGRKDLTDTPWKTQTIAVKNDRYKTVHTIEVILGYEGLERGLLRQAIIEIGLKQPQFVMTLMRQILEDKYPSLPAIPGQKLLFYKAPFAKWDAIWIIEGIAMTGTSKEFAAIVLQGVLKDPKQDKGIQAEAERAVAAIQAKTNQNIESAPVLAPNRSEMRTIPEIRSQLEVLASDPTTKLTSEKIEEIIHRIQTGELPLTEDEIDIIKIVDGQEVVIGTIDSRIAHRYSLLHRTSNAFVMTPEGKFLVIRRAHNKKPEPLRLSTLGGHLLTNETYQDTVKRKLIEGLGLPQNMEFTKEPEVIGKEGAYTSPSGDYLNQEIRTLWLYRATQEELRHIRATMENLATHKRERSQEDFEDWLANEQKSKSGLGDVWSIHELSLDQLLDIAAGKPYALIDEFRDGTFISSDAKLTSDLLLPLLKDPEVVKLLRKAVPPVDSKVLSSDPSEGGYNRWQNLLVRIKQDIAGNNLRRIIVFGEEKRMDQIPTNQKPAFIAELTNQVLNRVSSPMVEAVYAWQGDTLEFKERSRVPSELIRQLMKIENHAESDEIAKQAGAFRVQLRQEPSETLISDVQNFVALVSNRSEARLTLDDLPQEWSQRILKEAEFLGVDINDIETLDISDNERLEREEMDAGKMFEIEDEEGNLTGNFYTRSHPKDTARNPKLTYVATKNQEHKGLYNNWRNTDELKPKILGHMKGVLKGKKLYVIPYLLGPENSPFNHTGFQLTDNRYVALNQMRMTKVGVRAVNEMKRQIARGESDITFGIHVTGDLDKLTDDEKFFAAFPEENLILSFGSAYGGNALLSKKFELRLEDWRAWKDKILPRLMEHGLLALVEYEPTREKVGFSAFLPSGVGKTNLANLFAMLSDDLTKFITFSEGKPITFAEAQFEPARKIDLHGQQLEEGLFGVLRGTNARSNPNAMKAITKVGGGTIFTNPAAKFFKRQIDGREVTTVRIYWEGLGPKPEDIENWVDWKNDPITPETKNWAEPNSRFTTSMRNAPTLSPEVDNPNGVPVQIFLYGGKLSKGQPLALVTFDKIDGVRDGLTTGSLGTMAESTGIGEIKYDSKAKRPFYATTEGDEARHTLEVLNLLNTPFLFGHVNWFFENPETQLPYWPGYVENKRVIRWFLDMLKIGAEEMVRQGRAKWTPVGFVPTYAGMNLEGLSITEERFDIITRYDYDFWTQKIKGDRAFLETLPNLPQEIWDSQAKLESYHKLYGQIRALAQIPESNLNEQTINKILMDVTFGRLQLAGSDVDVIKPVNDIPQTIGSIDLNIANAYGLRSEARPYEAVENLFQDAHNTRARLLADLEQARIEAAGDGSDAADLFSALHTRIVNDQIYFRDVNPGTPAYALLVEFNETINFFTQFYFDRIPRDENNLLRQFFIAVNPSLRSEARENGDLIKDIQLARQSHFGLRDDLLKLKQALGRHSPADVHTIGENIKRLAGDRNHAPEIHVLVDRVYAAVRSELRAADNIAEVFEPVKTITAEVRQGVIPYYIQKLFDRETWAKHLTQINFFGRPVYADTASASLSQPAVSILTPKEFDSLGLFASLFEINQPAAAHNETLILSENLNQIPVFDAELKLWLQYMTANNIVWKIDFDSVDPQKADGWKNAVVATYGINPKQIQIHVSSVSGFDSGATKTGEKIGFLADSEEALQNLALGSRVVFRLVKEGNPAADRIMAARVLQNPLDFPNIRLSILKTGDIARDYYQTLVAQFQAYLKLAQAA